MSDSPTKPSWLKYLRDGALLIVLVVAISSYQTWSHASSGTPAPAFDLPALDGERISTSSLQGKPTVVYFWAPWCGVCEASSHNISAVHEAVGDDANVISVVLQHRDVDSIRAFMQRNEVDYPVYVGTNEVGDAYAIEAFPTLYVLDSDGAVVTSVVGYTTEVGIRARLWWAGI